MSANPWLVENIQEFSFLNCPECAFKAKEENVFQDHAVKNHSMSHIFFGQSRIESEFVTVKTEFHSEFSIGDKIIDPLEKILSQEFIISDIKTEEFDDIAAEDQSINPNENVSKTMQESRVNPDSIMWAYEEAKAPNPRSKNQKLNQKLEEDLDK